MNRIQRRTTRFMFGLFLFAAVAEPSAASASTGQSPPAPHLQLAHQFLLQLEAERTTIALQMLHPHVRQDYRPGDLDPGVRLGRTGGYSRRLISDRATDYRTAVAFRSRGLPGSGHYRIVCFAEVPIDGHGSIRFSSVLLGRGKSDPNWSVLSYRIQSTADREC